LKKVNEQAVKQAALEAAAKAAQAAIDVIARGDTFSDVFQLNGYGTSLEALIDKMDEDARNAKDGLSITKDEILLKVSDTEDALRAYLKLTKETILARVEDDKNQLNSTILQTKKAILAQVRDDKNQLLGKLDVQAGALHALVEGGGAAGQMALTVNLPVIIDDATRQKLIKASTLEKVNAVYAKVKDTDYYGIKGNAGEDAIKPLWEDARRAALLASQISLEADQIQFKSKNVFVNGKLKADYIDVLELAVKKTFTEKLIVQALLIDTDDKSDKDFEAWFDKTNGLKINNKGDEIFRVDTAGNVFAKNANFENTTLVNGSFSGNINTPVFEVSKVQSKTKEVAINTDETLKSVYSRAGRFYYECIDKNKNIDLFKAQLLYMDYRNSKRKIPLYLAGKTYWVDVTVDQDVYELYLYTYEDTLKYCYVETLSSTNTSVIPIGVNADERVPKNILLGVKDGSSTVKVKNLPTIPGETGSLYTYTIPFLGDVKILCVSP